MRKMLHGHAMHGPNRNKTFRSWEGMFSRCKNPNDKIYHRYGGRGIKVCERWSEFLNFLADMGEKPIGTSLDRINNDGNYEPGNCRWATAKEQCQNRSSNRLIFYKGEKLPITEVARRIGVYKTSLFRRLKNIVIQQGEIAEVVLVDKTRQKGRIEIRSVPSC
jgi:hypothetical protein